MSNAQLSKPTTGVTAPRRARVVGLPAGVRPGGWGRRLAAWLLDALPFPLLTIPPQLVLNDSPDEVALDVLAVVVVAVLVLGLAWALLSWWMLAARLATPGMRAMRLHAVQLQTGHRIGWGRALLRGVVSAALLLTQIGWIANVVVMFTNPRRQGLHDLAAGCVVIDADRSLPEQAPGAPEADVADVVGLPAHLTGQTNFSPAAGRTSTAAASAPASTFAGSLSPSNPWVDTSNDNWAPPQTPPPGPGPSQPSTPWASGPPPLPVRPQPLSGASEAVPVPEPTASAEGGWLVDLGQGELVRVETVLIVGRNPHAIPGYEADLVRVPQSAAAVADAHLAIGVDERGPWVLDLGSDGGTSVTDEVGVFQRCVPHERVRLTQGQIVSYGGRRLGLRRS